MSKPIQDHAVLAQVVLGYSPLIDRQRNVVATRLTLFPQRPDVVIDGAALLDALSEVWPASAAPTAPPGPRSLPQVSLNPAGEALLSALMLALSVPRSKVDAWPRFMLEIPAFVAADPVHTEQIKALAAVGVVPLLKGTAKAATPALALSCFAHAVIEPGEDARAGASPPGSLFLLQAGVRSSQDIERALARGVLATIGWPFDDPPPRASARSGVPADVKAVMELIDGVERQLPVPMLEAVLRGDPTLAFRLMRYLNSPAFGLTVEINSFGHALMMLGYQRLKRWLALLLAMSAKGGNARPFMFAAVRRGLLMEALAGQAADDQRRGEMFICGVFSLLDRLLQQPFSELLPSLPVPEPVQAALRGTGGPYQPALELVLAIERESVFDITEAAERLLISPAELSRAVLGALLSARDLDA
jgi:EAL and modified HD-GYP domain-containing signal transduction protein